MPTRIPKRGRRRGHDLRVRPDQLLREIKAKRVDPATFDTETRRSVMALMADGRHSTSQLASLFGVSTHTVYTDLSRIRKQVGDHARTWGVEEVVGRLVLTAESCTSQAMREGDAGLAWSIQAGLVRLLKELGVVEQQRDGVRVTIEALGQGYERAREQLTQVLDPRLTGRQVETKQVVARLPMGDVVCDSPPQVREVHNEGC